MDKDGFVTVEEIKAAAARVAKEGSRSSVGLTPEREKYKNKYSRIVMEARIICERYKK